MVARFCSDCHQESAETKWSAYWRIRLCVHCLKVREDQAAADWTYQDINGETAR